MLLYNSDGELLSILSEFYIVHFLLFLFFKALNVSMLFLTESHCFEFKILEESSQQHRSLMKLSVEQRLSTNQSRVLVFKDGGVWPYILTISGFLFYKRKILKTVFNYISRGILYIKYNCVFIKKNYIILNLASRKTKYFEV